MKYFKLNKWIIICMIVFAVIWSFSWSIHDGRVNLVPVAVAAGAYLFVVFMNWLMRNNP
jgi:hypothetical protein